MNSRDYRGAAAIGAGLLLAAIASCSAQTNHPPIDTDDIGGVVTSSNGPEAGVWVIAETKELSTRFIRIVATDDQGRYVVPDLPPAQYSVWVRGYGLIDSEMVQARPGETLDLTAVVAPDPRSAAVYYPPKYWLSLLDGSELDLAPIKDGCLNCHQIGNQATREIPAALGTFESSLAAWDRRVKSGVHAPAMAGAFMRQGPARQAFADWTDRIAAGAIPEMVPPRPSGVERNVVVTQWDWGGADSFSHTHAATDRSNPTVNANGRIWGPDGTNDSMLWLDPVAHETGSLKIRQREALEPWVGPPMEPSPYWGTYRWPGTTNTRSGVMDHRGRPWIMAKIRGTAQPDFCKSGSMNRFAEYFPLDGPSTRQMGFLDPATEEWILIDTCWTADHNEFGGPPDHSLFFGASSVVAWVNTRILDETKDEEAAQAWCPAVLDTNSDGQITKPWTEPEEPINPMMDHRVTFGCYYAAVNPVDDSIWCAGSGPASSRRHIVRVDLGSNPPQTCKAERYTVPPQPDIEPVGERGLAIDTEGVVWVAWRASDHITSFDRRKCNGPLDGPQATGPHCPEGWTVYRREGEPTFMNSELLADDPYSLDVDQFDWSGLGKDTKLIGTVNSDAITALLADGEWVDLHIPYPMGHFTRNVHGRIDDPEGGWKGRGLWSAGMTYTGWHQEGGKGETPKVVKIQVRPDPLAK